MPQRYERQFRFYLEVAVLLLAGLNAWWTSRVDTAVAQMEVRMERRITDLLARHEYTRDIAQREPRER